jgi:hypothetical protein
VVLELPEWIAGALCGELDEDDADRVFFPRSGPRRVARLCYVQRVPGSATVFRTRPRG